MAMRTHRTVDSLDSTERRRGRRPGHRSQAPRILTNVAALLHELIHLTADKMPEAKRSRTGNGA